MLKKDFIRQQTKRQQQAIAGTSYSVKPYGSRFYGLYDRDGALVAVFAYLKGASAVAHRLASLEGERRVSDEGAP